MRTVRLQVPSDDHQMSVAGGLGPGLGESYVWWPEGGGAELGQLRLHISNILESFKKLRIHSHLRSCQLFREPKLLREWCLVFTPALCCTSVPSLFKQK